MSKILIQLFLLMGGAVFYSLRGLWQAFIGEHIQDESPKEDSDGDPSVLSIILLFVIYFFFTEFAVELWDPVSSSILGYAISILESMIVSLQKFLPEE